MYIVKTINGDKIDFNSWIEIPKVKISSITLLSPDTKSKIEIEGYSSYVGMKEALVTPNGFEIVANICYAINKRYSVKYRITNTNCVSTLIENSSMLKKSLNKSTMRNGAKLNFMI
jgi:hypothetical protein